MKKWIALVLGLALASFPALAETHRVKQVTDGDTLVLDNGQRLRLIGVDTPEMHDARRNGQTAKRKGLNRKAVNRFADEAKAFVRDAVEGRRVDVQVDWERQDKYGRALGYVYRLPDKFFLNAEIIKQGYGFAYTRFPFKYLDEFRRLEKEARAQKRGLWKVL